MSKLRLSSRKFYTWKADDESMPDGQSMLSLLDVREHCLPLCSFCHLLIFVIYLKYINPVISLAFNDNIILYYHWRFAV